MSEILESKHFHPERTLELIILIICLFKTKQKTFCSAFCSAFFLKMMGRLKALVRVVQKENM